MISYAMSNTHHFDCFVIKDTIDFPYLSRIQEIDHSPLYLDLKQKPLMTSN
jgi:hypothetical protein